MLCFIYIRWLICLYAFFTDLLVEFSFVSLECPVLFVLLDPALLFLVSTFLRQYFLCLFFSVVVLLFCYCCYYFTPCKFLTPVIAGDLSRGSEYNKSAEVPRTFRNILTYLTCYSLNSLDSFTGFQISYSFYQALEYHSKRTNSN